MYQYNYTKKILSSQNKSVAPNQSYIKKITKSLRNTLESFLDQDLRQKSHHYLKRLESQNDYNQDQDTLTDYLLQSTSSIKEQLILSLETLSKHTITSLVYKFNKT